MAIPADALMRGDKVYVKDDSVRKQTGMYRPALRLLRLKPV
jgi:hypothetical protein